MTSAQDAIAIMTERIVRGFDPEQIILFGSHARGDMHAESDIDLLVVMPNGTDRRAVAVAIHATLSGLGVAKDIVITTPAEIAQRGNLIGTVLYPALREGKVLYDRARGRSPALAGVRR